MRDISRYSYSFMVSWSGARTCSGECGGGGDLVLRENILRRSLEMEVLMERLLGDSYLKNIFRRLEP